MNNIKTIIFDYDGIIAESVDVKTEAFAEIYGQYGKDVVDKVTNHHRSNGGVTRFEKFKIYHNEFLNLSLSKEELNNLTNLFSSLVLEKVISSSYIKGVYSFIKGNYNNYNFFISTGTPKNEIDIILKRKKLNKYFIEVFGSPEKKDYHVKKILKKYNYKKSNVVFIGDSTSDRNAALSNDIKFIGRFTTTEEIKNEKYLIKDFIDFKNYLNRI